MRLKAFLLLCILVSLGVLVAWQVGLIGQPATERVGLEAVVWEYPRPTGFFNFSHWMNTSFADDSCSLIFASQLYYYEGYFTDWELELAASVSISGKSPSFYVKAASVTVANLTGSPWVTAEIDQSYVSFKNLSLAGVQKRSVQLVGNGGSKSAYLYAPVRWYMADSQTNPTCKATLIVEVVYFNGTMFRQTIQPYNLTLKGV